MVKTSKATAERNDTTVQRSDNWALTPSSAMPSACTPLSLSAARCLTWQHAARRFQCALPELSLPLLGPACRTHPRMHSECTPKGTQHAKREGKRAARQAPARARSRSCVAPYYRMCSLTLTRESSVTIMCGTVTAFNPMKITCTCVYTRNQRAALMHGLPSPTDPVPRDQLWPTGPVQGQ